MRATCSLARRGASSFHRGPHRTGAGQSSRATDWFRATSWATANGDSASHGTFADAASFGEVVFNCTSGGVSLDALRLAGLVNLDGKPLMDVANPLDFSRGMPPSLTVCNTDSLPSRFSGRFRARRS